MNNNSRRCFLWELEQKINQYVKDHDLFCGGCCYSAYVLATVLKAAGIKYHTVMWQYYDILKEKNFNNAINGKGVSHVAIEVTVDGKKAIIGDCSGIKSYFQATGYQFRVRKYADIDPEELLAGYKKNNWNAHYDTSWNKFLVRDIKEISSKYIKTPHIRLAYKRPCFSFLSFFGF